MLPRISGPADAEQIWSIRISTGRPQLYYPDRSSFIDVESKEVGYAHRENIPICAVVRKTFGFAKEVRRNGTYRNKYQRKFSAREPEEHEARPPRPAIQSSAMTAYKNSPEPHRSEKSLFKVLLSKDKAVTHRQASFHVLPCYRRYHI